MEQAITSGVVPEVSVTSRLTVVLHPNHTRIDIALNDRMFNTEKYNFSRKREARGSEKDLLDYCETYIVGIGGAKASKNILALEIEDGVLLREFIPQVVTAVKRWGSEVEPYEPEIYVDNRRWEVEPKYRNEDDWFPATEGIKQPPGQADIGIPYKVWASGR